MFRRTSPGELERIKVTIIPDENGDDEQKERLRSWTYDVDESLTPDEFKRLILSVCFPPTFSFINIHPSPSPLDTKLLL